jgi:hypothetical protein
MREFILLSWQMPCEGNGLPVCARNFVNSANSLAALSETLKGTVRSGQIRSAWLVVPLQSPYFFFSSTAICLNYFYLEFLKGDHYIWLYDEKTLWSAAQSHLPIYLVDPKQFREHKMYGSRIFYRLVCGKRGRRAQTNRLPKNLGIRGNSY